VEQVQNPTLQTPSEAVIPFELRLRCVACLRDMAAFSCAWEFASFAQIDSATRVSGHHCKDWVD
jgi:hypothetical protein